MACECVVKPALGEGEGLTCQQYTSLNESLVFCCSALRSRTASCLMASNTTW